MNSPWLKTLHLRRDKSFSTSGNLIENKRTHTDDSINWLCIMRYHQSHTGEYTSVAISVNFGYTGKDILKYNTTH